MSVRAISDTTKNARTISNRKPEHQAKKKWNAETIPLQNKSAPTQTCLTVELTYTAAKAVQLPVKPKQLKVEWKDSSIIVNGTNHSLPTKEEYILK